MRFREDTPAVQRRAREEIAAWRAQNPVGTVEEMLAALGPRFHKDCAPVLRSALFRVDDQRGHDVTGTAARPERAGRR